AGGGGQKGSDTKEQLQREHRYLKRRLEQLVMPGGVERTRTDSLGSTISTDSEQEVDIEGMESPLGEGEGEGDSVDESISDDGLLDGEEEEDYNLQSSSSDASYTQHSSHRLQPHHC
ncbi:max dimerization protein 4-like, partial [Oncorhynchus kisutch]|uniref:max dimerization protein 4-like n=1 Tax=Oncorhynchus kisutch TaxID=8019 RepID=UPI0012DF6839